MMQRTALGLLLAALAAASGRALADSGYRVCKSTYALCTTAECMPVPGRDDAAKCACEVRTGYSVGSTACQPARMTGEGEVVLSRYYPIKSYAQCANERPWAWCYDKECVVDQNDPSKANCMCSVAKDKGPYVMVTDNFTPSTCTLGLYSSATVTQLREVTDFLVGQSQLPPFHLKLVNPDKLRSASERPDGRR